MIKTAESVSPMHPDKICDRISDTILDECLRQDPSTRAGIETIGGHGIIMITGELTTEAWVDFRQIAAEITHEKYGIQSNIVQQSSEIAQGVDTGGAGDQGIMTGFATSETKELIPKEMLLSRKLCQKVFEIFPHDGKTQITLKNDRISAVVCSFQHAKKEELEKIIRDFLSDQEVDETIDIFCNPCGDWDVGGFEADAGLTGRKLAVDNYGPQFPIGGGCFSGKDATKVDRSAAYMARKIAVDYLKEFKADEVHTRLAYSIGVAKPVMAVAEIKKRGKIEEKYITKYDLTPKGITEFLDLRKPQFAETAKWGHFGNGFLWDR